MRVSSHPAPGSISILPRGDNRKCRVGREAPWLPRGLGTGRNGVHARGGCHPNRPLDVGPHTQQLTVPIFAAAPGSGSLTGRNFSGLNLRGVKMDRALLTGADFTGARLQAAKQPLAKIERSEGR